MLPRSHEQVVDESTLNVLKMRERQVSELEDLLQARNESIAQHESEIESLKGELRRTREHVDKLAAQSAESYSSESLRLAEGAASAQAKSERLSSHVDFLTGELRKAEEVFGLRNNVLTPGEAESAFELGPTACK